MSTHRGLALLLVVGVLGILGVLATTFVTLARLERRASLQRLHATKALLLALSGIEDALARLSAGQEGAYGGEDWNGDAVLGASPEEAQSEVYRPGNLDTASCPVRHAVRPSFFRSVGGNPRVVPVGGRLRGYTGRLGGEEAHYALKVEDLNGKIHINGGVLDAQDRDPDGPGSAPEGAPLLPNGIPDHRDPSMEGPNGFLVRLLNNLDEVLTGTSNLGVQVFSSRPPGGYRKVEDLKAVLGPSRYEQFRPYLTVQAWVDPKVVKPQPMDGRPQRFLDIDDTHRIGTPAATLSGVPTSSGISGAGTETSPWTQSITVSNQQEFSKSYGVSWERGFVYAWRQLRLAPPAREPRAPVALNSAAEEVLASVFLGLKGSYLDVWEGGAGWDNGFAFLSGGASYPYPDPATEPTPWIRTRVDYGAPYGSAGRSWYGPAAYDSNPVPDLGKPAVQAAPLGRLKETAPISLPQARAIAGEIRRRVTQKGPFRTWAEFDAFVDALPRWEDMDNDLALDGPFYQTDYQVPWNGGGELAQRGVYRREDANSDKTLNREIFTLASGGWATEDVAWVDRLGSALSAGEVPGLSFVQKDVIRAMANPNSDLNDFNPDGNLWKEVDKTDLAGIASGYAHTTELDLAGTRFRISASGRVVPEGRLLAQAEVAAEALIWERHRDSTQADFMADFNPGGKPLSLPMSPIFSGPVPPYPLAGAQTLVSYPEPQNLASGARAADAAYDGQIGLGLVGIVPAPWADETLKGALFNNLNAQGSGDLSAPDVRGPFRERLVRPAGLDAGNLFPDGAYSEKDAALLFPMAGVFDEVDSLVSGASASDLSLVAYVSCWVKPNWFPEASPRIHALASLSYAQPSTFVIWQNYLIPRGMCPMDSIPSCPVGCYFVPARNNYYQDTLPVYEHSSIGAFGKGWPRRSLIWGTTHTFYESDTLNVGGLVRQTGKNLIPKETPLPITTKPVGRLEGHRWMHLALLTQVCTANSPGIHILAGRAAASSAGGSGWNHNFYDKAIRHSHLDGTVNHLRFGEVAAGPNMNYTADATFADVRAGSIRISPARDLAASTSATGLHLAWFSGASGPAATGRYYKEYDYLGYGATYTSPKLPASVKAPGRITWTEVPCDLWFDSDMNGWADPSADPATHPENDRFGPFGAAGPDGLRDVRIRLEVWDDSDASKPRAVYEDPAGANPVPAPLTPTSRLYYKAVFVNDWDDMTRLNHPLDATPFLDDVTITYLESGGPRILAWSEARE